MRCSVVFADRSQGEREGGRDRRESLSSSERDTGGKEAVTHLR